MRNHSMTRRQVAGALLASVFVPTRARSQAPSQGSETGGLMNPSWAGRPRKRVTDADIDPFIIGIEQQLKCNCGCAHSLYVCRTTDFNCEFWQPLHAEVVALADREMTAEQIIDAYVAKHGEAYLMAPIPEGFNLAGYLVPGVLITMIGGALAWFLVRRTRVMAVERGPSLITDPDLPPDDAAKIQAEFDKLGI